MVEVLNLSLERVPIGAKLGAVDIAVEFLVEAAVDVGKLTRICLISFAKRMFMSAKSAGSSSLILWKTV